MDKSTDDDFVEIPRWVRLLNDRLYFGGRRPSRRHHLIIELFCIAGAVVVFVASFEIASEARANGVRAAAFVSLLCAYLITLQIRAFDRYGLWAGSRNASPEKPRTWRGIAIEYAIVLGLGIVGVLVVIALAV